MNREQLVEQIELIRQRLAVSRRKLAGQAIDPNRQTLVAMYRLLAKNSRADELELTRLMNELATFDNPVWRPEDRQLADRLRQFLAYWNEVKDEPIWDESQLRTYVAPFRARIATVRNSLVPGNRHLHTTVNEQLAQTEEVFKNWYKDWQKRLPDYGPAYRRWLQLPESLDQRIEQLQNQLSALVHRTPGSLRELHSWHGSMQATIEETSDWIQKKYFSDIRRRLPIDKGDGVERLFDTVDKTLEDWHESHRKRTDWLSTDRPEPEKQIRSEPVSKSSLLVVEVFWKDVTFKDRYIDVLASFSISQVYHHANYSLRFDGSRRSFQAFASILDTLGLESLQVHVIVRDRSVVKVLNAYVLTELIDFLTVKETFGWLEWDTYRGAPQDVDDKQAFRQHPGLNRHECLRHLAALQSRFHRIIFVEEYSSAIEYGRGSIASDAYLFTVDQGSCLYIIWENEEKSLATYIFKTTKKQYYIALQRIHDYVTCQTIQSKRMRLREGDLQAMNGSVQTCQFVIHDDLRDWQNKLARSLR